MTAQLWENPVTHLQLEQPLKESRIPVEQQAPVRIACQIVVPLKQVFSEGFAIQGIAVPAVLSSR
ncbi:hypothetical protein ACLBVW_38885, partial [Pseudomonas aeruginosa]|uniref:hypothetical protein n=1 Tax=Pseudomonas aeruginosa TaxID=287 RepID=UPI00396A8453